MGTYALQAHARFIRLRLIDCFAHFSDQPIPKRRQHCRHRWADSLCARCIETLTQRAQSDVDERVDLECVYSRRRRRRGRFGSGARNDPSRRTAHGNGRKPPHPRTSFTFHSPLRTRAHRLFPAQLDVAFACASPPNCTHKMRATRSERRDALDERATPQRAISVLAGRHAAAAAAAVRVVFRPQPQSVRLSRHRRL